MSDKFSDKLFSIPLTDITKASPLDATMYITWMHCGVPTPLPMSGEWICSQCGRTYKETRILSD